MSELEQQWLQQQLKKLLSFDDTIVESIADALVNATDEKHLASIFTDFMPSTPAVAAFQAQYLARRAKAPQGSSVPVQPPPAAPAASNTKKAAPARAGTSVTYRPAPSRSKTKGPRAATQGPAGLASQLDKRVVNCLGCGKIFHCTLPLGADAVKFLESGGICTFCSRPVALYVQGQRVQVSNDTYPGATAADSVRDGTTPPPGDAPAHNTHTASNTHTEDHTHARAAAALALKERLVEYDRNSAQRTSVIDDQSDYYAIESNAWLTDEERSILQAQQQAIERAAEERKNRIVVTFDLLGRQVLVQDANDASGTPPMHPTAPGMSTTMFAPGRGSTYPGASAYPGAHPPQNNTDKPGTAAVSTHGSNGSNNGSNDDAHVEHDVLSLQGQEGPLRAMRNPAARVAPVFIAQP